MKHPLNVKKISKLAALMAVGLFELTTNAQNQVFYEDWSVDHSFDGTYKTNYTAGGVSLAHLYFDYSTAGIPLSPNSTNGDTHALKMSANLDPATAVFPSGVSVSPVGFGITENFEMHFDYWGNFNGPLPGGGSGSTQVGGAGYGTAGTTAQVAGTADSIYVGATVDGGSSADYRVYAPSHQASYQATDFRVGSDGIAQTTPGDPSSGYVYAATNRNNSDAYYTSRFPAQQCPTNQFLLYPQQTNSNGTLPGAPGSCAAGALSFKWHDVSVRKVANTLTYSVDSFLIATINIPDAGTLGGTNILFNAYDINAGASTDPNRTNLAFSLIDNIRITNFASVVSVSNTISSAAEGGSDGIFTIVRTSSGVPITVNYTLSGSAVNGVDYTNLSGSVTMAAAATSTNIYVHPIDDTEAEVTETVVLDITPSPNFIAGGSATITISDNETPVLSITNISKQMYEATNDYATFKVTRLGNTNSASFNVNLAFSGTATAGVDYYTNALVTFDPGFQSTNFNIYPIVDSTYEGNEIATVNLAAGGGYVAGASSSASITLIDADRPVETVLFSDNFDADHAANWSLKFASTNVDDIDYTADFAFDYSGQSIPPSPHGNGSTLGLRLTVNKDVNATAVAAGLNLYPNGQSFSGNYALRFDMLLNMVSGASSTEYAICGLNHSGTKTNWWRSGGVPAGWTFDGVFYAIESDAQASPNFINYSAPTTAGNNPTALTAGTNSVGFASAFKSPPWAVAGSPAVNATSNNAVWADVELSQISGVQTLSINKTVIFSYTNTTPFTSGNIMLGYVDAFDSRGTIQNYVVYDNVRVVSLAAPVITATQLIGGNAQIDFTAGSGDVVAQFVLQAAPDVSGPYVDVSSTLTSPSAGNFRAVKSVSLPAEFYRIRRIY